MKPELSPGKILELGTAFWASKTLLSAVELGLFTELAKGPLEGKELAHRLRLHPRAWRDFFDALVALGMLDRDGKDLYRNTPETALFLDRNKPSYVGGMLEMLNARLFRYWNGLTEALRTGEPQNEMKEGGSLFDALYRDTTKLKQFLQAMTGVSMGCAVAIAQRFPWKQHKTFFDVGGAQGCVAVQVALAHPHVTGGSWDLAATGPIFEDYVRSFGLEKRLHFEAGDFFKQDMPKADVLIMGHVLHDWNVATKKMLLEKAYKALPKGGALIVYEALIDDDRRKNAFGLLMSLNMLIETPDGFDYTGADCRGWMKEVGFSDARVEPLVGPDSMVIGIK